MIRMDVERQGQHLRITATGHALHGQPGQDIVCAAASMLIQAFIAWVQQQPELCEGSNTVWFAGDAVIDLAVPLHMEALVRGAVDVVVTGFHLLEKKYPDNVTVGAKK